MPLYIHRSLFFSSALFVIVGAAQAQETPADIEAQIAAANAKYEQQWQNIRERGDSIKEDAPQGAETAVDVDMDCENKRQEVKLDIPEVTMKLQRMSVDVPQVAMKTRTISWDNPETFMATTTCGWYPEFRGLRVKMSPIKCDLPQVRMVRKEAKLDVPEFKFDRTDLKMHVPEFRMDTQRWTFDFPECRVRDVSVQRKRMENDSKRLQEDALALSSLQQQEMRSLALADLIKKRQIADEGFVQAIAGLEQSIAKVREYGIDPTRVRQEDGSFINLLDMLTTVSQKRVTEMAKLDQSIASMTI